MGYIKDNYQTTNQFFKDVKNGINDIGLRLDDLESRREDVTGGGIQQVLDEEPEEVTVDPFQYDGPFAVKSIGTTRVNIEYGSNGASDTIIVDSNGSKSAVIVTVNEGDVSLHSAHHGFRSVGSPGIVLPEGYGLYAKIPTGEVYAGIDASSSFAVLGDWASELDINKDYRRTYAKLAHNSGGQIQQIQYGGVVDVTPKPLRSQYEGPFAVHWTDSGGNFLSPEYIESKGAFTFNGDGTCTCYLYVQDTTPTGFGNTVPRGWEGNIVQGDSQTLVKIGYPRGVLSATFPIGEYAEVYLYYDEDEEEYLTKVITPISSGLDEQIQQQNYASSLFGSNFYTRLATVACWRGNNYIDSQGQIRATYSSSLVQNQFGDIVDVSFGSVTINSSSIYSSTYVDSRTINVDSRTFVTSTYIDSRSYSSTIITSGGMEYRGAFLVEGGIDSTQTDNPFIVSCVDGQGRANNVAGYVIAGNKRTAVTAMYGSALIDGARVYLVGTPDTDTHTASYQIKVINNNGTPNVTGKQWYTQLAYKSGGQVYQTQFGDVVAPYEVPFASAATSAYNGGVNRIIAGSNTWISPSGGTGSVTINTTGGGGSGGSGGSGGVTGGMLFPDYAALAGGNGGVSISPGTNTSSGGGYTAPADGWLRISILNGYLTGGCFKLYLNGASVGIGMYQYNTYGGGTTAIIPIKSGTQINYTADGSQNMVVYAPGIGGGAYGSGGVPYPIYGNLTSGGGGHLISAGSTYPAPADGWLRVSIKNENATAGCVRLTIGGAQIGVFECKSNAGGTTQMYPIKSGTEISYTAPSNCSCFVQFDH